MRILLLDDHPLILEALQARLKALDRRMVIVEAMTPEEAIAALEAGPMFNQAFIDLNLGEGISGFTVLETIRRRWPDLTVIVMSGTDRLADVVRAMDMGALAFVPKRIARDELDRALRMIASNGVYIPRVLLDLITRLQAQGEELGDTTIGAATARLAAADAAARREAEAQGQAQPAEGSPAPVALAGDEVIVELGLTPRQTDVLHLLRRGLPNKLIARELNLSVETVKDHVAAVLRAVGVASRTQAVLEVNRRLAERQAGRRAV